MPIRRIRERQAREEEERESEFSPLNAAATAVRVASGMTPGGPIGGVVAAGGEGIAQLLENAQDIPGAIGGIPDILRNFFGGDDEVRGATVRGFGEGVRSPIARMAIEGGLGSVPGGKLIKAGSALESFLRSGALSGVGSALRQQATAGEVDIPSAIGTGIVGGGIGAGISKFLNVPSLLEKDPDVGDVRGIVEQTIQDRFRKAASAPTVELEQGGRFIRNIPAGEDLPLNIAPPSGSVDPLSRIPYNIPTASPLVKEDISDLERLFKSSMTRGDTRFKALQEIAAEEAQRARIAAMRGEMVPDEPVVSESFRANLPGGGVERATQRFSLPEGTDDVVDIVPPPSGPPRSTRMGRGPAVSLDEPSPTSSSTPLEAAGGLSTPLTPVETVGEGGGVDDLVRFFRTRVDAMGQANRDIKAAKAAGEVIPEAGRAAVGKGLQAEARAAGLPTRGDRPQIPPTPSTPRITEEIFPTQRQINEQSSPRMEADEDLPLAAPSPFVRIDDIPIPTQLEREAAAEAGRPLGAEADAEQVSILRKFLEGMKRVGGNERGEANPAILADLLTRGLLGVGGSVVGATTEPFGEDNPTLNAAAGFAAGAASPSIPSILRSINLPETAIGETLSKMVSPEGIKDAAATVYKNLPHLQRFNYLADIEGLPANAIAGPYGSALMGALEAGLSGDARGWALLKELSPQNFIRNIKDSIPEAIDLVKRGELGRTEGLDITPDRAMSFKNLTALPGFAMTTGDVAARRLAQKVGFEADTARKMTLTSEPEFPLLRNLSNVAKGSTIGQLMFPFVRTPVNILEQGLQRLPGVGSIVQSMRETPDTLREQAAQQSLAAILGAGNYVLGANLDPETARTVRRYTTNLGGRYSLPSTLGFAAGLGSQTDQGALDSMMSQRTMENALPLPTVEPLADWYRFISGEGEFPRGGLPPAARNVFFPKEEELPSTSMSNRGAFDPVGRFRRQR